jgi:aquaporin SIP
MMMDPLSKWVSRLGFVSLVCADMAMGFLWVFLNSMVNISVEMGLPFIGSAVKTLVKKSCVVALLFLFYGLSKLTRGATYNPLTIIAYAGAEITHFPLYLLSFRVPAQVHSAHD